MPNSKCNEVDKNALKKESEINCAVWGGWGTATVARMIRRGLGFSKEAIF